MEKISLCNREITFNEAFKLFITAKERDGLSAETVKTYKIMIKVFTDYTAANLRCQDITKEVFDKYKDYLMQTRSNYNTINTYLRHLRVVINFLIEEQYTGHFKMKLLKVEETIKDVYTDGEIDKLLKRPDLSKCGFSEYRTWVVINYILATGNRLNTLRNIQNRDIRYTERDIFLRETKGKKQYFIPLSSTLSKVLKEYQSYRKGKDTDFLFCSETGTQLSRSGLQTAMHRYNKRRGVDKTSEHLFRHTFAKMYYKNSGDIFALNYILGHKDLEMTRHYINMYCSDIRDFEEANPLDNLNRSNRIRMTRN